MWYLFVGHHLTSSFFMINKYINVATVDIIILVAVGIGAIIGFIKGFIRQLASILGLVAGLLAAKALYSSLALKLCPAITDSMTIAQVLAFIMIWIAVPVIFVFVASLLTKAMQAISLNWLNRWLGSGLGALKLMLLTSVVIALIEIIDIDNKLISATNKKQSLLYYPMEELAGIFVPVAKNMTQQYIFK